MIYIEEIKSNVKEIVQCHINTYGSIPISKTWDTFHYTPTRYTIKKYTSMTYTQLLISLGFEVQSQSKNPQQTESEIILSFNRFYNEFGYAPTVSNIKEIEYLPSISNLYNCFNSIEDAINAANIPRNVKGFHKESALKSLDEFIQEFGRIPNKKDLEGPTRNKKYPEYRNYAKLFGGIKNAVLELDYNNYYLNELLDIKDLNKIKSDIISIVEEHYSKYNTIPGSKEWDDREYKPPRKTIEKLFNTPFNKLLEELNFKPKNKHPINFSRQQLIQLLIHKFLELGRTPTFEDMKNIEGAPHPRSYVRAFGSYEKAVDAANLDSNKHFSKEFIISEVKRYINTEGLIPSTNTFRYNPNYPGIKAYTRVFGSFNNCLIEMGITPRCFEVENCYSKKCISLKGNICNSKEECIVDDFLYSNGINFEREIHYPYHEKYNPNNLKRCDFLYKLYDGTPVYIEYAGLISKKTYKTKLEQKISLCEELNLMLIVIYPHQLSQLYTIILSKLKQLETGLYPLSLN